MLIDFENSLTDRLIGKFATNSCLNIPSHLTYVTKLAAIGNMYCD